MASFSSIFMILPLPILLYFTYLPLPIVSTYIKYLVLFRP